MTIKIVILTERGENIGFGHLTRCLSLCQAFESKEHEVEFIVNGDDSNSLTPKVLSFLTEKYPSQEKNVIIGNAFKNFEEIKVAADLYTRFIHSPDDMGMKEIMVDSDVAISSGGQTLYELARVGVPTVAVAMPENHLQEPGNNWCRITVQTVW